MGDCRRQLRKVGLVLALVAALDIGLVAYCAARGWRSSDAVGVLVVMAFMAAMGAPLIWGSLRLAQVLAFYSAFLLSLVAGGLVILPLALHPPLRLVWLYLRLRPLPIIGFTLSLAAFLMLAWWAYRMLTRPAVLEAIDRQGGDRQLRASFGFALGPAVLVVVLVLVAVSSGGEGSRVREAARRKVGPDYQLFVWNAGVASPGGGPEIVCGDVAAYNDHEIKTVHVKFRRWE